MTKTTCSIDNCARPAKTRGMCGMHAERVRRYGDAHYRQYIQGDDVARFWSKVEKTASCWLWHGTLVGGYGQFSVARQGVPAHRYAYEMLVGPIPDGHELDHVRARGCTNTNCVNPAHLEPVTQIVNLMRSDAYSAVNARKTHCVRGHEFDRVLIRPDGRLRRRCTICHRAKTLESQRRIRAERARPRQ